MVASRKTLLVRFRGSVPRYKATVRADSPSTPCASQSSSASPAVYRRPRPQPALYLLVQFPDFVPDLRLGPAGDLLADPCPGRAETQANWFFDSLQ